MRLSAGMGGAEEGVARSPPLWCSLANNVASTSADEKRRVGSCLPPVEEREAGREEEWVHDGEEKEVVERGS